MSLPFIRIIDLRAEGEGAIREAWLPPPYTHTQGVLILRMVPKWSPRP